MGQHDKSRLRIRKSFAEWVPPKGHEDRYRIADQVLDNYLEGEQLATEWDADQWGLPDYSIAQLEPHAVPPREVAPDSIGWTSGLRRLEDLAAMQGDVPRNCLIEPAKWEL